MTNINENNIDSNVSEENDVLNRSDSTNENNNINHDDINLNNINLDNINPDDINKLLNNLNLDNNNNLESLIHNFSKGKIGSVLKDFSNLISSNESVDEDDDVEFDISNNNLSVDEECEEEGFELNLEKFFMSSDGKNICDVLCDIKDELKSINNKLKKD